MPTCDTCKRPLRLRSLPWTCPADQCGGPDDRYCRVVAEAYEAGRRRRDADQTEHGRCLLAHGRDMLHHGRGLLTRGKVDAPKLLDDIARTIALVERTVEIVGEGEP